MTVNKFSSNDLPCYKSIRINSGVDRYGFSSLLAEDLGLIRRPRAFANWLHGWIWWGAKSSIELMFDPALKNSGRFVVSNNSEKSVLEAEGFQNIWVGGLPFSYVEKSKLKRVEGSLLAMPPHSSEREKLSGTYLDYLDYLEAIKHNFSMVSICIHYLDMSKFLAEEVRRRGLHLVEGARPNDANSLRRMRAIFDSFEYVSSSSMGSHILYSMFAGCKVSLCGPFYEFTESDFRPAFGSFNHEKKYIDDLLFYLSRDYLSKNFRFLMQDHPFNGYLSEDFAKKQIGFDSRLNRSEILSALGWRPADQITGYAAGAVRRVERSVQSMFGGNAK